LVSIEDKVSWYFVYSFYDCYGYEWKVLPIY